MLRPIHSPKQTKILDPKVRNPDGYQVVVNTKTYQVV